MSEYSEMFKALAVENRVRIIELLKTQGPLGPKEIARVMGITPAAVSQHLKILRHAGLVRPERKGYWIPYAINAEALEKYRQILNEVCTCGCQGTGKWKDLELGQTDLAALKKYEEDLLKELRTVRERIKEVEAK